MRCVYPALAMLFVSSTAAAEEAPSVDRGFVAASMVSGVDESILAGVGLEAGVRISRRSAWLRVAAARAVFVSFLPDSYEGDVYRGSIGVEARSCARPALCAIGGVDLGYYYLRRYGHEKSESYNYGLLGTVRFGLDSGGEAIRLRASLGVTQSYRERMGRADDRAIAVDLTLGLGIRI